MTCATTPAEPSRWRRWLLILAGLAPAVLLAAISLLCAQPAAAAAPDWVRQLGTLGSDMPARGVAVDGAGNVYATGRTNGTLPGSPEPNAGGIDIFVVSWDSSGATRWVHQLGTDGYDEPTGVAVDGTGNVYVTGSAAGKLPDSSEPNSGLFVASWDSNGATRWVRQPGPSSTAGLGVAADSVGNVYVTGDDAADGSIRIFVASFEGTGATRWVQHMVPSDGWDSVRDVALDGEGNVYVTGTTYGTFPGSPIPNAGNSDVYVASWDSAGTWRWVRQLGGTGDQSGWGVASDGAGNVYVTGRTEGPWPASPEPNAGQSDVFVASWTSTGETRWVHQLGTSHYEPGNDVAVDTAGNILVTGYTEGTLPGSAEPNTGSSDVFVACWDRNGVALWVQQLGTTNPDAGTGVTVDTAGDILVAGDTAGELPGSPDPNSGDVDIFVAKWGSGPVDVAPTASIDTVAPSSGMAPLTTSLSGSGTDVDGTVVGYSWDFGDATAPDTSGPSVSHTYTASGTYSVRLTVTDDDGYTGTSPPVTVTVTRPPDGVTFRITGGISYANSQLVTAGGFSITRDAYGIRTVAGTATFASSVSGNATVTANVSRILLIPVYLGTIRLSDPGAHISLNHPIFFSRVNSVGTTGATNTQGWIDVSHFPWKSYTMTWTMDDPA